jgi:hypothetical protein
MPHLHRSTGVVHEIESHTVADDETQPHSNRLPKFNFPTYDGDTTKLWITQAEDYFDMYGVPGRLWVKVTGMHFNGAAKRWIQSLECPTHQIPWTEFCSMLLERFAHDQHESLILKLFHIQQTSIVVDYVERCSTLFDQLKAYTPNPDMRYYTTRFIDGLRYDIRVVVAMQRPQNLDTLYSLSLLQEEVATPIPKLEFHKANSGTRFRGNIKAALPLPHPLELAKAVTIQPTAAATSALPEDKLSTLCLFRRAQGLCDRCAEKWFRGHKCAPTIQLQAMLEVWDLFQLEDVLEQPEEPTKQLNLAISHDAHMGSQGPGTIQFQGTVHGQSVVVLIDSGSSTSFLADSVANRLPQLPRTAMFAAVKIANGQILRCSSVIVDVSFLWVIINFSMTYAFYSLTLMI